MLHYQDFKSIAIIPARGGSKGIPKKNIKLLAGKPLLAYTIEVAQATGIFDKIIVSTDSDEIAKIAEDYKAQVIKRPDEIASDTSPTEEALIHVLDVLEKEDNYTPTVIMTLEPTAPLRSVTTIKEVIKMYKETKADSVMTLEQEHECHAFLRDNKVEWIIKDLPRRRQDREPLYKENGGTYLTEVKVLRDKKMVLGDNLYGYALPAVEAVDINEILDFHIVESIINKKYIKI